MDWWDPSILVAGLLKLLGASTATVLVVAATALVVGVVAWAIVRSRHGPTQFAWQDRRRRQAASMSAAATSD